MSAVRKNGKIGLDAKRQPLVCTQLICDRKSQAGDISSEAPTLHFIDKFLDIPPRICTLALHRYLNRSEKMH